MNKSRQEKYWVESGIRAVPIPTVSRFITTTSFTRRARLGSEREATGMAIKCDGKKDEKIDQA